MNKIKIAPSILSADFARLGEQVKAATEAGAEYIHVDVMDGRFVPQITVGAPVVAAVRRWTDLPLDVHLMITDPESHIKEFAAAGASIISVHAEATRHLHRLLQAIKQLGARAGVAINPGTPAATVEEVLGMADLVLVMTVNPGFGGQTFIEETLPKIARIRQELDRRGIPAELEVDGGINAGTVAKVVRAGATVLVAGAAVFSSEKSIAEAVAAIRHGAEEAARA